VPEVLRSGYYVSYYAAEYAYWLGPIRAHYGPSNDYTQITRTQDSSQDRSARLQQRPVLAAAARSRKQHPQQQPSLVGSVSSHSLSLEAEARTVRTRTEGRIDGRSRGLQRSGVLVHACALLFDLRVRALGAPCTPDGGTTCFRQRSARHS
jgi:hypothetical protein